MVTDGVVRWRLSAPVRSDETDEELTARFERDAIPLLDQFLRRRCA